MTTLAAVPVDPNQLDLLNEITDTATPLGSLHANDFRAACVMDAARNQGWINPNHVSAILHERFGDIKPQWFSGMWAATCGPKGFMDKTDRPVQIDGKHSRGNGNKATVYRRLRVAS